MYKKIRYQLFLITLLIGASASAQVTEVNYTSFKGDSYVRYAYEGENIALLLDNNNYDLQVMENLLADYDQAFEFYTEFTQRIPSDSDFMINGKTMITIVDDFEGSTCGSGCGKVGSRGIEIRQPRWDQVYQSYATEGKHQQIIIYEMGRNFTFFAGKTRPLDMYTPWAVFMSIHISNKLGFTLDNLKTNCNVFSTQDEFADAFRGLFNEFFNGSYNFNAFFGNNEGVNNNVCLDGGGDVVTGLYFYMLDAFGEDFLPRYFRNLQDTPSTYSSVVFDASINNVINSASKAAGSDLRPLFDSWNWTVPTSTVIEAETASLNGTASVFDDQAASGGKGVGFLNTPGASLTITNAPEATSVKLRYASENSGSISVYFDSQNTNVTFASTGAWTGNYNEVIVPAEISQGDQFAVQFDQGDAALNIDNVTFIDPLPTPVCSWPDVPLVALEKVQPSIPSSNDGELIFSFGDDITRGGTRTNIEFSINNGQTFTNVLDSSGRLAFSNLSTGEYQPVVRWANGECQINMDIVELPDRDLLFVEGKYSKILSYAGSNQDVVGDVFVSDNNLKITLTGNRWKAVQIPPYVLTENTILEFDFKSDNAGEEHSITLDNDLSSSNERFKLLGSENWPVIRDFDDYVVGEGVKNYKIPVGQYLSGTMDYIAFGNDDDKNQNAHSEFSNIKVYEPTSYVYLVHKNTGNKLGLCSDAEGERVKVLAPNDDSDCALWEIQETEEGYFYLYSVGSDHFIRPNENASESPVVIRPTSWDWHWTQWRFLDTGDGFGRLVNRVTGMYLTYGNTTNDPAKIAPTTWQGDWTRWRFEPAN